MLEILEAKLKELAAEVEKSFVNHNVLLGAKTAVEQLIAQAKTDSAAAVVDVVEKVVEEAVA